MAACKVHDVAARFMHSHTAYTIIGISRNQPDHGNNDFIPDVGSDLVSGQLASNTTTSLNLHNGLVPGCETPWSCASYYNDTCPCQTRRGQPQKLMHLNPCSYIVGRADTLISPFRPSVSPPVQFQRGPKCLVNTSEFYPLRPKILLLRPHILSQIIPFTLQTPSLFHNRPSSLRTYTLLPERPLPLPVTPYLLQYAFATLIWPLDRL